MSVIDEIHAYRGVFGSNLANVIRGLKRICAFYGSDPTVYLLLGDHRESQANWPRQMIGRQV